MSAMVVVLVAVAALALGAAIGWLLRAGPLAAAERSAAELPPLRLMVDGLTRERDAFRGERDAARLDLATARAVAGRVEALEEALGAERARSSGLAAEKAAFERGEAERAQAHAAQMADLDKRFGDLAGKALGDAQKQFLERADQRFAQAGEKSEAQLKALLQPVETTLKQYDEKLGAIEKARDEAYGGLKEAVSQLSQGNEVVRRETARLTNVLRSSPKHRGRWGEEQLRTILESAGMTENVDFSLQTSITDGERQLRPDCVINLPGGRTIVVDVKCPLVHFEQAYDEEDETVRAALLLKHADAMKAYAADLGRKGYWRQFDLSPDFVIMFVPGEHFLSAAAERAPDLIEQAFRSGVIIASTINMLALAKVMAGMWRQEGLARQAEEIGKLGKDLYARLSKMGDHVTRLGKNLNQATGAYNDFVGSLESQVLTQAKRFEALKIDTQGKAIDPLPMVDQVVRPLTKLSATPEQAAEAAE
ncbi:DNA recombination protein RmuC [Sphingomonas sp. AP4-R1]|uniref:DNA recombination protein RmuC n=1 Tax=Sphingomonas sp. AP4-R1 TaxID=2735134 RepID=UPI0014939234|nr:DNA recombination protein RmuC [Sphingomonas sp. AP4-R1]QJU57497.1 DNA recombination protein RmuC [Sphingomonas sp. AP4-R1]